MPNYKVVYDDGSSKPFSAVSLAFAIQGALKEQFDLHNGNVEPMNNVDWNKTESINDEIE